MQSRWTLENGEILFYSSNYYSFTEPRIEFCETVDKDQQIIYYTLIKKGDEKTELTIDIYKGGNWFAKFLTNLSGQKKMESLLQKSLENLNPLLREIDIIEC